MAIKNGVQDLGEQADASLDDEEVAEDEETFPEPPPVPTDEDDDTELGGEEFAGDEAGQGEHAAADTAPAANQKQLDRLAELERLEAEVGPYLEDFRALVKKGFSPAEAKAAVQDEAEADGAPDPWGEKKGYDEFWEKATEDPKVLREAIARESAGSPWAKKLLTRLDKIEKENAELTKWRKERDTHIDTLRGKDLFAEWEKSNPEVGKHKTRILELVNKDGVKDWNRALKIARAEALLDAQEKAAAKAPKKTPPGATAALGTRRTSVGSARGAAPEEGIKAERGSVMRAALRSAKADLSRK